MRWLRSNRGGGGQGVLAVVAIICIGVAAFFIVKQTKPKDESAGGVFYYCTSCEKEFVAADQDPPIKCPKCGQLTGVYLRKCKCNKCGTVFPAYLLKWDLEVKRRRERRRQGDNVPYGEDETELVSAPDEEYWVNSELPEGIDIMTNIFCPKCEAGGEDIEPVFPRQQKK